MPKKTAKGQRRPTRKQPQRNPVPSEEPRNAQRTAVGKRSSSGGEAVESTPNKRARIGEDVNAVTRHVELSQNSTVEAPLVRNVRASEPEINDRCNVELGEVSRRNEVVSKDVVPVDNEEEHPDGAPDTANSREFPSSNQQREQSLSAALDSDPADPPHGEVANAY